VIVANLQELSDKPAQFAIDLATKLRARVQELTQKLEIIAPVYVVFTKTDLIDGFVELFEDQDQIEREQVWGATLPFETQAKADAATSFDAYFDELCDGLKQVSIVRMAQRRGEALAPGVLTFPLEFAALRAPLRTFITTLFEDNPFQFRPIFRGFYFTSAVQQGQSRAKSSAQVLERFAMSPASDASSPVQAQVVANHGFFLKNLFSKVILADKNLVQQYTSRRKVLWRYGAFLVGALALGTALTVWTSAYLQNEQWVAQVQLDLERVTKIQNERQDLQSRLQALDTLQQHLQHVQAQQASTWRQLGLGRSQYRVIEKKLSAEYFAGLKSIMLKPTADSIASYLAEVNTQTLSKISANQTNPAAQPNAATAAATDDASPYSKPSSTDASLAYDALKTYIMLGNPQAHFDAGHLVRQVTYFWRDWLEANRGTMARKDANELAVRIVSFAMATAQNSEQNKLPAIILNNELLGKTRENLTRVYDSMDGLAQVYEEIKRRAAVNHPPLTVASLIDAEDKDLVSGSYVLSGAFTREAWSDFVGQAIKEAAQSTKSKTDDWVLGTSLVHDLTQQKSTSEIRSKLTERYKTEYAQEWQKFMQGVSIKPFTSLKDAVNGMNRLGDPAASPIGKLMKVLYGQTAWDNPRALNDVTGQLQAGLWDRFKQWLSGLFSSSTGVNVNIPDQGIGSTAMGPSMGPIGKEFAGLHQLIKGADNKATLVSQYLDALSKVRARLGTMQTKNDSGSGSRKLMEETIQNTGEIALAYKLVNDDMLVGQTKVAVGTLRPMLVRPILNAFEVIVPEAEKEVNQQWLAQVYQPFNDFLAAKYPFKADGSVEATAAEIAKLFGPEGEASKFGKETLGILVKRYGNTLRAETWADMGLRLRPELVNGFATWLAAPGGEVGGATGGAGGSASSANQTVFQILPTSAPGLSEYTIEIDGQQLRYRNTQAVWSNFVRGAGTAGVRVTGVTLEGKQVQLLSEPGASGVEKMFDKGHPKANPDGSTQLTWEGEGQSVSVQLRMITNPGVPSRVGGGRTLASSGLRGLSLPLKVVGVAP
jgi:type VI secretion system protein ImpL